MDFADDMLQMLLMHLTPNTLANPMPKVEEVNAAQMGHQDLKEIQERTDLHDPEDFRAHPDREDCKDRRDLKAPKVPEAQEVLQEHL